MLFNVIIVPDYRIKQRHAALQFLLATDDLSLLTNRPNNVDQWIETAERQLMCKAIDVHTANIHFDTPEEKEFDLFFKTLNGWEQFNLQLVLTDYEESEIHHSILFMNNILASIKS